MRTKIFNIIYNQLNVWVALYKLLIYYTFYSRILIYVFRIGLWTFISLPLMEFFFLFGELESFLMLPSDFIDDGLYQSKANGILDFKDYVRRKATYDEPSFIYTIGGTFKQPKKDFMRTLQSGQILNEHLGYKMINRGAPKRGFTETEHVEDFIIFDSIFFCDVEFTENYEQATASIHHNSVFDSVDGAYRHRIYSAYIYTHTAVEDNYEVEEDHEIFDPYFFDMSGASITLCTIIFLYAGDDDSYDDFLYLNMTETESRLVSGHDNRRAYFFMLNITNHIDLINFKGFIADWFFL